MRNTSSIPLCSLGPAVDEPIAGQIQAGTGNVRLNRLGTHAYEGDRTNGARVSTRLRTRARAVATQAGNRVNPGRARAALQSAGIARPGGVIPRGAIGRPLTAGQLQARTSARRARRNAGTQAGLDRTAAIQNIARRQGGARRRARGGR